MADPASLELTVKETNGAPPRPREATSASRAPSASEVPSAADVPSDPASPRPRPWTQHPLGLRPSIPSVSASNPTFPWSRPRTQRPLSLGLDIPSASDPASPRSQPQRPLGLGPNVPSVSASASPRPWPRTQRPLGLGLGFGPSVPSASDLMSRNLKPPDTPTWPTNRLQRPRGPPLDCSSAWPHPVTVHA